MILDDDKQIVESALDDMPITDDSLSERGWVRVGCSSKFIGHSCYIYWETWTRHAWSYPRIERYSNGCLFKRYDHDGGLKMHFNKDLRTIMYQYDIR